MKKIWWIGAVLGSICAWIAFEATDTQPPYELDPAQSKVTPPEPGGNEVKVSWRVSKVNRHCHGEGVRVLFDPHTGAILATYAPTSYELPVVVGNGGYLDRSFLLPKDLADVKGDVGYHSIVCYECNLFQAYVKPLCLQTPDLIFTLKDHK